MDSVRARLGVALFLNVVVVLVVLSWLGVGKVEDPLRGNVIALMLITLGVAFFVWAPLALVPRPVSSAWKQVSGPGRQVLVLSVKLPEASWEVRRFVRAPKSARVLLSRNNVEITWANGDRTAVEWPQPPTVESRKVWVPYQAANSVILSSQQLSIEYVAFMDGKPLSLNAHLRYMESVRELTADKTQ